ncbi:PKD domain-containing protein [Salinarchaeum laminariae]|uniref:PKD domain-containing protein n=1 Tax=Salinarchaeum laminariae TaxID=869888 RepID=UPI0020C035B3|nr:PKD domain-containing protein [Salinarchaeum laminariae]
MTDSERQSKTIATVVTLAILAVALLALTPTAIAAPDSYTVEQGDQCIDVDPIGDGSQSVEEFYDYRSNQTDPEGVFSSYGTGEYQRDNTSTMLLYNGSEGTSLVFIHEKLHNPEENGTNGSSITFNVTGIEPGDGWAVEDDDYVNLDDTFEHGETYSRMNWVWAQGRTDGGAYRGLGNDTDIRIDPAFNEAADERYNGYKYTGWVHDWEVAEGASDDERTTLGSLEESVTVQAGYCADAPTADFEVNDTTPPTAVGETVTLDAGSSDADAEIDRYEWDFTSNGTVDETTNESEINHAFETAGKHDVTVTVVDIHGQTDSATRSVEVLNETPPNASLDAPDAGVIGDDLTFDGSGSTDDIGIETYEWNFGDGTTIANGNDTETHAYDEPGTYTVELTTVDSSGNANTSTATVVVDPIPPTATLDAPESSTVGETVTLDASNSDADPDASYEWLIDGESVTTTDSPTYDHTFTANGSYPVQVNVSDEYGTDTANTTITVTEPATPSEPTAALDEIENTTVGSTVHFNASASDGDIVTYEWDFGDGHTTETETNSNTHVYDAPGTYTVELTVVNDDGHTDTTSTTVKIVESPEPPVARLDTPESATVGETVTLDASNSDAGPDASYEWLIDGESVTTTDSPTYDHTFTANGSYPVQVNVTDEYGTDTANTTITVTEATPSEPTAALEEVEEVTAGSKVHFDASASDGDVVTYKWDFGDGHTTETNTHSTSHVYDTPGTYTVELTVINDDGHTDTTSTTVKIVKSPDPPVARLDAPDTVVPGKIVTLNASASDVGPGATYEWIVEGESKKTTDGRSTFRLSFTAGEYDLRVKASDEGGTDTANRTITVEEETDDSDDESDNTSGSDDETDNSGVSGGYAPPSPPSEPVETSAEMVNGTLIVTAEGGIEAGEPFDVNLSTADSIAPDAIDYRSLEVTPAEDAETMTIEFKPAASDVPGRFSQSPAIAANTSHDVDSIAYEFAISTNILDAAGVSPSNLTAYTSADGDEWTAIETDAENDGDDVLVSGRVDGDDALGIGATGSALFLSDVTTNGLLTDGTIDLVATVRNTGTEQGEATIPIKVGDDNAVSESITLDADEEGVIETTVPLASATNDAVHVGGVRTELAVVTVADLTVPSTPAPNKSATVEATLVNHGTTTAEFDAELVVDDAVATTEPVVIEPGEQTTVAFDHQFGPADTYEIAVGNATESVHVEERDSFDGNDDNDDDEGSSDPTSGFGMLAALCAVIGALGVLGRKRLRQ